VGNDDIYLDAIPHEANDINSTSYTYTTIKGETNADIFCQNVKQFQKEVYHESNLLDNFMEILAKILFAGQN
jgi:hypothetical protein